MTYKLWSEISNEDQQLFILICSDEFELATTMFASRFNGKYNSLLTLNFDDKRDESIIQLQKEFDKEQYKFFKQFVCKLKTIEQFEMWQCDALVFKPKHLEILNTYPEIYKKKCTIKYDFGSVEITNGKKYLKILFGEMCLVKQHYQLEVNFTNELNSYTEQSFVKSWKCYNKCVKQLITQLNLK